MPPKHFSHHQQHQQPHHHSHPDATAPSTTSSSFPSIVEWMSTMLSLAAKLQAGPFAMSLVNHPYVNVPDQQSQHQRQSLLSSLIYQVEQLPLTILPVLLQQNRGTPLSNQPQALQTMYSVLRFFLQAVLLHYRPAPGAARNRLDAMLNAYSTFETFHKEERGIGEGGALLPVPGANAAGAPAANVGWDTAILVVLCQKIRALAQVPDALDEGLLSDLIRKWRSMFLFLVSCDKGIANNVARRRGALVVLNCLLAVLLHLGNLHQVKAILQTVDQLESSSGGDPTKGVFGPCGHIKSEVTKILYFQARVKLYLGNETQSFGLFAQVCERLPALEPATAGAANSNNNNKNNVNNNNNEVRRNKIRSLFYLCTNSILCGIVPDIKSLLLNGDKFLFNLFHPIINAINAGSPTKFEESVSDVAASVLRTRGVYLQLKQMYLMTIFVAVRRAHSILGDLGQDNSRIHIECISKVSKALDRHACGGGVQNHHHREEEGKKSPRNHHHAKTVHEDAAHQDSTSNINLTLIVDLGQMIQLGWIKGYISFEHQILVLSKKDPFPRRA